jgi:hypothetical protein
MKSESSLLIFLPTAHLAKKTKLGAQAQLRAGSQFKDSDP